MVRITARQQFDKVRKRAKPRQFSRMSGLGIAYNPPRQAQPQPIQSIQPIQEIQQIQLPTKGKIPLARSVKPTHPMPGTSNVIQPRTPRPRGDVINNRKITEFFSVMSRSPGLNAPRLTPIVRPGRRSQEFQKYHDDMTPKIPFPNRHLANGKMIDHSRFVNTDDFDSDEDDDVVIIEQLPPIPLRDHPVHEIE